LIEAAIPRARAAAGSYAIKDDFSGKNRNDRGTISMAKCRDMGGSQFFINLVDDNFLDSKHPVFGEVVEGIDAGGHHGLGEDGAMDRPVKEVKIESEKVMS
jgi:peptidylprolyl isomerase